MIKGMIEAMRSVAFALGLLFVMLYVFGIAFVQLCEDSPCEDFFPDVPSAMHELLLNAALMDGLSNLVHPLKEQNLVLLFLLYAFIFLSALTVMNMLIGVICEVVSAVAATERESLSLAEVRENIHRLLTETGADDDGDQMISKGEFMNLLANPKAIGILQNVDVDVVGLVDFKDTLFENDGETQDDDDAVAAATEEKKLTIPELIGLVLDLRGGNTATVRDIVNLRKFLTGRFAVIEQKLARLSKQNSGVLHTVSSRPSTAPHGKYDGGLEDQDAESTSDSIKHCPSAKLGSSPRFQDMFHSLQGLMSAHEVEIAAVEAENRELKEQVVQLASIACRSSLSEPHAVCTGVDSVTPRKSLVIPPSGIDKMIQPPKGPAAELRAKSFLPSSALRMAADGSAVGSCGQEFDVGTTNRVVDIDGAFCTPATVNPLTSQQMAPLSTKKACTASREMVAAP
eukprot:CAMPEP_0172785386 /NCGR_PEP_ID=MMETSP1074-20121228/205415_1 /TAXON_ID=2916 /ORGANISM="Ceratium fusus, Strain PA161109" /LENGTH=455 /DNA_ID=CAMNT_0013622393 /DNA_START=525 /DNA_END=1892 /DNA_ORIENTATION=-